MNDGLLDKKNDDEQRKTIVQICEILDIRNFFLGYNIKIKTVCIPSSIYEMKPLFGNRIKFRMKILKKNRKEVYMKRLKGTSTWHKPWRTFGKIATKMRFMRMMRNFMKHSTNFYIGRVHNKHFPHFIDSNHFILQYPIQCTSIERLYESVFCRLHKLIGNRQLSLFFLNKWKMLSIENLLICLFWW